MKATKTDIYKVLVSIDHTLKEMLAAPNFSKEDASVKAMTAAVAEATSELPPNKGEQ